ncbi:hypothetical protein EVB78_164 [Rhizobium phage RHph_N1_15]|nr:hypothetical protein EVB77_164 [Rhizobium phage RHph_N1_10]QIG69366.1 hypothetical protein EVB78_164 [Rhizobium phage RHph_N1_15]QIG75226.1 hypothetical protein EVC15_164 [Rhizobium phage RHph_N2_6]
MTEITFYPDHSAAYAAGQAAIDSNRESETFAIQGHSREDKHGAIEYGWKVSIWGYPATPENSQKALRWL